MKRKSGLGCPKTEQQRNHYGFGASGTGGTGGLGLTAGCGGMPAPWPGAGGTGKSGAPPGTGGNNVPGAVAGVVPGRVGKVGS